MAQQQKQDNKTKAEKLDELDAKHLIDTDALTKGLEPLIQNRGKTPPEKTLNTAFLQMVQVIVLPPL